MDDFLSPTIQFAEQFCFDFGVSRVIGDVVNFVGIVTQIKEFNFGLCWCEKRSLLAI